MATIALSAPNAQEHEAGGEPHWGYQGDAGPHAWRDIVADYALCQTGEQQSPIDLPAGPLAPESIVFDYQPSRLHVVHTGHSIQINYDPGSSLEVDGKVYAVAQFHFHAPSEHTIEGIPAPMEMHIVHRAADGTLAVIGILFHLGDEDNAFLAELFTNLPTENEAISLNGEVNLAHVIDPDSPLVSYAGSLTTPPCTEGVRWFVATEAETISEPQLAALVAASGFNARPIQPRGERTFDSATP